MIRSTPVRQKPGRGGGRKTGNVPVTGPLHPAFVLLECQGEGRREMEGGKGEVWWEGSGGGGGGGGGRGGRGGCVERTP